MPRIRISKEDQERGVLLSAPGWYTADIVNYDEKKAKTDGSTNYVFHFKISGGKHKGAVKIKSFSEKALGFMTNMWLALGVPRNPQTGEIDVEWSKETVITQPPKTLDIYVKRGVDNSKPNKPEVDSVEDFRATVNPNWAV